MTKKIVLDTNVLLMSISAHSPYFQIWKSFLAGKYVLCVSNDIIEEYAEILEQELSPKVSESIINTLLLRSNVQRCDPHFSFGLIQTDKDDNKFVDCAIVSHAEFIVTEDKHFSVLAKIPFPKVTCINIDEFNQVCLNL